MRPRPQPELVPQGLLISARDLRYNPEHLYQERELMGVVYELLRTLKPREESILRRRFGLDGTGSLSYRQTADDFQLSTERIRQIEARAFRKLRHPSRSAALKEFLPGAPGTPLKRRKLFELAVPELHLRSWVLNLIQVTGRASFTELEKIPHAGGTETLLLPQSACLVLWQGLSAPMVKALQLLFHQEILEPVGVDATAYLGKFLDLPVARFLRYPYSRPHWFPAVLRLKGWRPYCRQGERRQGDRRKKEVS